MQANVQEEFITRLLNKAIFIDIFEDSRDTLVNIKREDNFLDEIEKVVIDGVENTTFEVMELRKNSLKNQAKHNLFRTMNEINYKYDTDFKLDPNFTKDLTAFYLYLDSQTGNIKDIIRIFDPSEIKKNGFKYIKNTASVDILKMIDALTVKSKSFIN
ncbi:hypothetical protein KW496_19695 [Vibrio fluvialis]|nr:hypothetical protein [Vibrio fluvialis]